MSVFRLTKKFTFEMAHALPDYDGACRNLHGHSYKLEVTVKGATVKDNSMVLDFHTLKELVNNEIIAQFDHALLLNSTAYPQSFTDEVKKQFEKVVLLPFSPTTEHILTLIAEKLKKILPHCVYLHSLKLQETENSVAEWFAEDNLPKIKNIIFDLGGVIYDIRYENIADKFKEYGLTDFEKKYSKAFQTNDIDLFEEGKISIPEFRNYIRSLSSVQLTDQQIDDAWNAIIIDVPEKRVEMLQKVKQQYRIYLFSNTNQLNYDKFKVDLKKKFGVDIFDELFKKAYFSHILHIKKPKIEAFQKIIEELKINPSETLFIDDSIQHINGAMQTGLLAYHLQKGEEVSQLFDNKGNILSETIAKIIHN